MHQFRFNPSGDDSLHFKLELKMNEDSLDTNVEIGMRRLLTQLSVGRRLKYLVLENADVVADALSGATDVVFPSVVRLKLTRFPDYSLGQLELDLWAKNKPRLGSVGECVKHLAEDGMLDASQD